MSSQFFKRGGEGGYQSRSATSPVFVDGARALHRGFCRRFLHNGVVWLWFLCPEGVSCELGGMLSASL